MEQHFSCILYFILFDHSTFYVCLCMCIYKYICVYMGFPGDLVVTNLPTNRGIAGSTPGSGRSPGEGNDNPLQYSCLRNPMDRGAWRAWRVHRVEKS